jgi:hypothetical protein
MSTRQQRAQQYAQAKANGLAAAQIMAKFRAAGGETMAVGPEKKALLERCIREVEPRFLKNPTQNLTQNPTQRCTWCQTVGDQSGRCSNCGAPRN